MMGAGSREKSCAERRPVWLLGQPGSPLKPREETHLEKVDGYAGNISQWFLL